MEKNFGTRVRQARHKAGLTQAALAEKLNLDETTISRIENGSQATSFATMLNFSEALDVKFDYLICDYLDDSIHSKDPINAEILDMITPLPDNYKRLIRDNIYPTVVRKDSTRDGRKINVVYATPEPEEKKIL